ncbi:hypothetical protein TUMEXPCC7403_16945 [Tumidithrix helvetica PCC 7403]
MPTITQRTLNLYLSKGRYTIYDPMGKSMAHYQDDDINVLSRWLWSDLTRLTKRGYDVKISRCEMEMHG